MSYNYIQVSSTNYDITNSSAARSISFTSNVTANNDIYVFVAIARWTGATTTASVSDNLGTTYTAIFNDTTDLDDVLMIFRGTPTSTGSCTIQVTPSAAAGIRCGAAEFPANSNYQLLSTPAVATGTSANPSLSFSVNQADVLLLGAVTYFSTHATSDPTPGFELFVGGNQNTGVMDAGYNVVSTDTSLAWSLTASRTWKVFGVSIKTAADNFATGYTVTASQSSANRGKKAFATITSYPNASTFNNATTIVASTSDGDVQFLRSDGTRTIGSITLTGSQTGTLEYYPSSSNSTHTLNFSNNQSLTNPSALSFTINAIEASIQTLTAGPSWSASDPLSGWPSDLPVDNNTVYGSVFTKRAISDSTDRAWCEIITDNRYIGIFGGTKDKSGLKEVRVYLNDPTSYTTIRSLSLSPRGNWPAYTALLPNVDGWYAGVFECIPFNGKSSVSQFKVLLNVNGTIPTTQVHVSNASQLYDALYSGPTNAIYEIIFDNDIQITLDGDGLTDWTSALSTTYPIKINLNGHTLSGSTGGWYDKWRINATAPVLIIDNGTIDRSNIGLINASHTESVILGKDLKETYTFGEPSIYLGTLGGGSWECTQGIVHAIGGGKHNWSMVGVGWFLGVSGLKTGIPDATPSYDVVQVYDRFTMYNYYSQRMCPRPDSSTYLLSVTGTSYSSGFTTVSVSGMNSLPNKTPLKHASSLYWKSGIHNGQTVPVPIGSTDINAQTIIIPGNYSDASVGDTLQLSTRLVQRLHFENYLTVASASYSGGQTTITLSDLPTYASDPRPASTEVVRIRTNASHLAGLEFSKTAIDQTAGTITVDGDASSLQAGDQLWLGQVAHADRRQVGYQGSQLSNTGPSVFVNTRDEWRQGLLQQPGSYSVTRLLDVNSIATTDVSDGVSAKYQIQQSADNELFEHQTLLGGPVAMRNNASLTISDLAFRNSILESIAVDTGTGSNYFDNFENNHTLDGSSYGLRTTGGSLTIDEWYVPSSGAASLRVWRSHVPVDIYGNTRGEYSSLGAVESYTAVVQPTPSGTTTTTTSTQVSYKNQKPITINPKKKFNNVDGTVGRVDIKVGDSSGKNFDVGDTIAKTDISNISEVHNTNMYRIYRVSAPKTYGPNMQVINNSTSTSGTFGTDQYSVSNPKFIYNRPSKPQSKSL